MSGFHYAFSLPKSAVQQATPPGTVELYDYEGGSTSESAFSPQLRVSPTPSSCPSDPLNWSPWRKAMALLSASFYCLIANITSSSLSSALVFLAMDFHPPVAQADLTHLIAVNVLMLGCANIWWVPLSNVFGRRPIILCSLVMLTVCSVWTAKATSFNSILVARLFQGIAGAASETICPGVIGEIYFRHQRGRAMAIYTIFLVLGPIIGGIIGGYIAHAWGWRWTQWLNVIISGVSLLACFFFLPETLFDRDAAIAMAAATEDGGLEETKPTEMEKPNIEEIDRPIPVQVYEPYTFASSLKVGLYRGGLLQHFMAPWKTLRFPAVWLVMLHYGGLVGGMVTTSTVGPQFVSAPPYNWGANAGLINVGGFVGSIAGAAFTFFLADYVMKRQALRQSNGLSEPEARLPALIPGLFLATMGLLTFGFCGENPSKVGWLGLQFGYGMLTFGVMQVPSIGFNYVIESYSAFSHDCLVMITCLRAIIGFAWTFFVGTWVESRGAAEPFGIFGMFMGIVGLLTVPIYFWGKRIRIATQKWAPGQT
ncbi:MFS general substrate transporter [Penicillium digitatum]|uniref:MFS general substrate transporter n=1 Tax=Penicillium digitatum TaxID=36651 RepID=A0A7T7BHC2_PENDI|nr:MFS general substrate transporter [Penicillium digitatum]